MSPTKTPWNASNHSRCVGFSPFCAEPMHTIIKMVAIIKDKMEIILYSEKESSPTHAAKWGTGSQERAVSRQHQWAVVKVWLVIPEDYLCAHSLHVVMAAQNILGPMQLGGGQGSLPRTPPQKNLDLATGWSSSDCTTCCLPTERRWSTARVCKNPPSKLALLILTTSLSTCQTQWNSWLHRHTSPGLFPQSKFDS